jgi:hypothetical protein
MKATKEHSSRLPLSLDLAPQEGVRSLFELCRKFIYEYYETGAPWNGPDWWLAFNKAGTRLREALERERTQEDQQPLSDREQEQAYILLIRVAYFFEPGGLAESFFYEQGWLQAQASPEDSAPVEARAKRSLLVTAADRLWGIWTFTQRTCHRDSCKPTQPTGLQAQPGQSIVAPPALSQQETGFPSR